MSGDCDKCGEHCLDCLCLKKEIYFLIHVIEGHPELNRLVTGVWSSYEGAKIAFDHYKETRPDFSYGIASYPVYEKNEGLF